MNFCSGRHNQFSGCFFFPILDVISQDKLKLFQSLHFFSPSSSTPPSFISFFLAELTFPTHTHTLFSISSLSILECTALSSHTSPSLPFPGSCFLPSLPPSISSPVLTLAPLSSALSLAPPVLAPLFSLLIYWVVILLAWLR